MEMMGAEDYHNLEKMLLSSSAESNPASFLQGLANAPRNSKQLQCGCGH